MVGPAVVPVAAGQEIHSRGLILPINVWYMILKMVQKRPAFGFYFSWYFTR